MTSTEIRKLWVEGQQDFKDEDEALKRAEARVMEAPNPVDFKSDAKGFFAAMIEAIEARNSEIADARHARDKVRQNLEKIFDTECKDYIAREKSIQSDGRTIMGRPRRD
jgi:hypothetical protein